MLFRSGYLSEMLYATVFKVHPYRWPVIGWMPDLDHIDLKKCKDFYGSNYAPNNAVVIVAGDFDSKKAKALIDKYYSPLPASKALLKATAPAEPEQTGSRMQRLKKEIQTPMFAVAYRSPAAGEQDANVFDLLANVLGEGQSSRLYRKLVYQEQIATSVTVYNHTLQKQGIFQAIVSLKSTKHFEKAKKIIEASIAQTRERPVSERELQKAKNQIMKTYVDALKTVNGKAYSLALSEVFFGDYQTLFNDLGRYDQVTVADMQKAAKSYLTVERMNVVLVEPK